MKKLYKEKHSVKHILENNKMFRFLTNLKL